MSATHLCFRLYTCTADPRSSPQLSRRSSDLVPWSGSSRHTYMCVRHNGRRCPVQTWSTACTLPYKRLGCSCHHLHTHPQLFLFVPLVPVCSSSSSLMSRVQTGSTACTFPYKRLGCSCLRLASSYILDCSCSIVFRQFLCVRRCPDLIYSMHLAIRALGLLLSPSSHILDCPFRFVVSSSFFSSCVFRHRVPVRTTIPVSVVSSLFLYHESWVFPPAFRSAPLRSMLPTDQPSPAVSSLHARLPPVWHQIFPPLRKCPHRLSCYFLDLDLINSRTPIWTLSFHYCYILTVYRYSFYV